jgi:hypothetical protein
VTYDDWKLASPPEYERERDDTPAHRCFNWACCGCGACSICGDRHAADCLVKQAEEEEDIKW